MTSQVKDDDDDIGGGGGDDNGGGGLDWWCFDSCLHEIADADSSVGLILDKDGDENTDDEEYNDGDVIECDDVVVIACEVIADDDVDVDDRIGGASLVLAVFESLVCIVAVLCNVVTLTC